MRRPPRQLGYGEEATLVEHLEELRSRLFVVIGAFALCSVVAFAFHGHILDWLNRPLPLDHRRPVTLGVAEPFTVSLTVSLYAGFVASLPVTLWQTWGFFAPAFGPSIGRRTRELVAFATCLAAAGLGFGYWILLPRAIHFLTNYDNTHFTVLVQAKPYYSFVSTVLLGVVVVFELPLVVLGLVHLGALTATTLRRRRRMGYFLAAVIGMGLPGPDPVTTALEILPMWVLFEGSIWLAVLVERRAARAATPAPAAGPS